MKLLAIGDFHGKFPEKLKRKIEKENPDLILGTGDYANLDKIRKLIFKYWSDKKWYDVVGLKKAKQLEKESFNSGLKILKELNSIGKPIYIVWGNTDFYNDTTVKSSSTISDIYEPKIKKMKHLKLVHLRKNRFDGIEIFGHGGYVDVTEFIKHPIDNDRKKQKERLKRYKIDEIKLYRKISMNKPKKGFIFLIHYPPHGYFDKVKLKTSPMYGKHVGFEPYNKVIKKYKPSLVICGHMHEYQGKKKIGNSIIVSTGAAQEGKAAIIEIDERKNIKKIEFIK